MKNIAKKIVAVMEAVGNVEKDKTNSFHNYKYVSDEAIVTAVRKAVIKQGLVILPSQKSCVLTVEKNAKGEAIFLTTLEIEYTIVDSDSGEETKATVFGYGKDKEDKGVYKAATGAEKYFLLKTFMIPTADDPEDDRRPQPAPQPQRETYKASPSVEPSSDTFPGMAIRPAEVKKFTNKKPDRNGEFGSNFRILDVKGNLYRTFDEDIAQACKVAAELNEELRVEIETNEYGTSIKSIYETVPF